MGVNIFTLRASQDHWQKLKPTIFKALHQEYMKRTLAAIHLSSHVTANIQSYIEAALHELLLAVVCLNHEALGIFKCRHF